MTEELLPYYSSELAYLRKQGDAFGRAYPKIARRLRLNSPGAEDPHITQLMEGFAFLTARIRKKLDDDFPEIAESFLNVLAPQYLAPIPSLSITQFHLDQSVGKLTTSYDIPRHSMLESEPVGGERCLFRTCYPVKLWPLSLTQAGLDGPPFTVPDIARISDVETVLHLRIKCANKKLPIGQLGVDSLRFYLAGQRQYAHELYELIFNNAMDVVVATGSHDPTPVRLGAGCLQPVGFEQDHALFPHNPRTARGYQLLAEYFAFPDKFLFFDITGLGQALEGREGDTFDLFIYFNGGSQGLQQDVSAKTFRLGCTPIVNLFSQTAEPISLAHEQSEYQVVPDARRPGAMEIYSVDRVATANGEGQSTELAPLYSIRHTSKGSAKDAFWFGSRKRGIRREGIEDSGTEVHLSFVDLSFNPATITDSVAKVQTTCINRDLPGQLLFGGESPDFRLQTGGPFSRIECLTAPTPTVRPQLRKSAVWRLISSLSLNHLSVTGGSEGAEALKELLRVYDFQESIDNPFPYDGILNVESRRVVGRINAFRDLDRIDPTAGVEPGFCSGLEITVELDEERFVGAGMFLFATVLERFVGMYSSINSFSKLVLVTKQRKELRKWSPRVGTKPLH